MTNPCSDNRCRPAELADLQSRLSLGFGTVMLRFPDDHDALEIEAFLIAMFDISGNDHSFREQDDLIKSVTPCLDERKMVSATGCGVEIILRQDSCEMRYHGDENLSVEQVAQAILQTLRSLADPMGMVLHGLAKVWDSASIEAVHHRNGSLYLV